MILRKLKPVLLDRLRNSDKAVILYGARQVGKTTLVKDVLKDLDLKVLEINADEQRHVDILSSRDSRKFQELTQGYSLLFIDEAQRIPDVGLNLKILVDSCKGLKLIATGSSSFELAAKVSEPLTGRKWTFVLYPISQSEIAETQNVHEMKEALEERLIWGAYPEIFNLKGYQYKEAYLRELSRDYLFKDLLMLADIRNSDKLRRLLRLLAFQIGNEVSLHELAQQIEMSKETVQRYIDLLEKTFVIFSLSGFSRNLRKEVTKSRKYFFHDLGVRNILIDNLKSLSMRNDHGALWENFLISERLKQNSYTQRSVQQYFWRTYTGAEIDYVEDGPEGLKGYEIKYGKRKGRAPKTWNEEYSEASWGSVDQENWTDFVL